MRVYDCFTFYNEFELLELRLKVLYDLVDYFVIVEANRTFTNKPKDFNLPNRKDDFKEFAAKIRYIPADLSKVPFKGTGDWSIEYAQRNAIAYGLTDAAPDDLIMISDLDEIPAPDIFQRLQENRLALRGFCVLPLLTRKEQVAIPAQLLIPATNYLEVGAIALAQRGIYYYFDRASVSDNWPGTILVKRKNLTTPQHMRNLRNVLIRASGGGYHFSYMGGVDRVMNKMTSIVDGNELVVKSGGKALDRKHVEEVISKGGIDLYLQNESKEAPFPFSDARNIKLPYLDEFLRKYPYFLHEPEKYFGENVNGATDL